MRAIRLAACVAVMAAAGCGPAVPARHPVAGTVVLRGGRPVVGAVVEFAAGDGSGGRGRTGPDGRFEIAAAGQKGLAAGAYRVAVVQMVVADGAAGHATTAAHHARFVVHPKYATFDTAGLTREVAVGPNDFTFELDPAAETRGGW